MDRESWEFSPDRGGWEVRPRVGGGSGPLGLWSSLCASSSFHFSRRGPISVIIIKEENKTPDSSRLAEPCVSPRACQEPRWPLGTAVASGPQGPAGETASLQATDSR